MSRAPLWVGRVRRGWGGGGGGRGGRWGHRGEAWQSQGGRGSQGSQSLINTTIFSNLLSQAHTWSNLELLESGPGRRALPIETDKESDSEGEDEQGEVGEQVVPVLLLSNRLGWRFVVSVIHSFTYWQNWCNTANLIATRWGIYLLRLGATMRTRTLVPFSPSWQGIIFTLLSLQGKAGKVFFLVLWSYKPFPTYSMRDQSSNLQGEDRKAYAEKVTVSYQNISLPLSYLMYSSRLP